MEQQQTRLQMGKMDFNWLWQKLMINIKLGGVASWPSHKTWGFPNIVPRQEPPP
jgi:hypothetical protein